MNKLVHVDSQKLVFMVKVALSKVDIALTYHWVKVSLLIEDKVNLKINIEVFEH